MNYVVWLGREIRARCLHAEEAACLVAFLGNGARIVVGRRTVWEEGKEVQPAAESYDYVTEWVEKRLGGIIE